MEMLQALILGIVQGLTEFLPVSSSGHLVLLRQLFGIHEGGLTFEAAVHFATLFAVLMVFKKELWEMVKNPFGKLPLLILAGTIPTVVIGLMFEDLFENLYTSGITLGIEFIFTGTVLWYADHAKNKRKDLQQTTYLDAVVIGLAQGVAILPAVSRSGLTLAGALLRGLDRGFAARLSFLLSIPAILGAGVIAVLKLLKGSGPVTMSAGAYGLAMAAALISGYAAIRIMLKVIAKGRLHLFSFYVLILGILIVFDQLVTGIFFEKLI